MPGIGSQKELGFSKMGYKKSPKELRYNSGILSDFSVFQAY